MIAFVIPAYLPYPRITKAIIPFFDYKYYKISNINNIF